MSPLTKSAMPISHATKSLLLRTTFLLALSLGALFTPKAHAQELKVQADLWCPYNCEPHSAAPGYIIELLRAIYGPKNIQVHYEVVPWDRVLVQTRDGRADAAIAATEHEVAAFGLLTGHESVGYSSDCLYVGTGNQFKFSSADDLAMLKRIGISSGYGYSADIDAWLKKPANRGKIIVQKGDNPAEINARNLSLGRLDGVIEDDHVMQHMVTKLGIADKVALAGCQKQTQIFVAFSPRMKDAQQAVKQFDEGMDALRQSQQLARILAKYGLTDWK